MNVGRGFRKFIRGAAYTTGALVLSCLGIFTFRYAAHHDVSFAPVEWREVLLNGRRDQEKDLKIINDTRSPNRTKAAALLHLGTHDENKAFILARRWIHSEDPDLVKAAIGVLRFSPRAEDEKVLWSMYESVGRNPKLQIYRKALFNSLSGRSLDLNGLYRLLNFSWTSDVEKVKLYGAIYGKEQDPFRRDEVLRSLRSFADRRGGDEKVQAVLLLCALRPRDAETLHRLRTIAVNREPEILPDALMHLARVADPWWSRHFRPLLDSPNPDVQWAAIRTFPLFCPSVIPDLDRIFSKTRDMRLRRTIVAVAARYRSKQSKVFLQKALALGDLNTLQRKALRIKVAEVKSSPGPWCP